MRKIIYSFLLIIFFPTICFAEPCDDIYNIRDAQQPSVILKKIIVSGNKDCLTEFLKSHKNQMVLNEKFTKPECKNCSPEEIQLYGTTSFVCTGETPLTCSIKFHDLPMVKMLVEAGADINKPNVDGDTPLIISVSTKKGFHIDSMQAEIYSSINNFLNDMTNFGISIGRGVVGDKNAGRALLKDPVYRLQNAQRTDIDLENYLTYNTILNGGDVYNDVVRYLLDKGADIDAINDSGENAIASAFDSYQFPLNISKDIFLEILHKSKLNDSVYKYDKNTVPMRAYCWGMSSSTNMIIDELFKAGYDINKKSEDGKTFCDIVKYDDFVHFNCPEIECNIQNKGKIQPCAMPNGFIQITDGCEYDKKNGTKICDGTKWSECSLERGDNKCRYYTDVCDCTSEAKKTDPNVIQADKQKNTGKCEIISCAEGYDISENKDKCITSGKANQNTNNNKNKDTTLQEAEQKYQEAKAREQSLENRSLTTLTTAATGIGGMELAQGLAEQKADKDAERDMKAYMATFRCEYGNGKSVKSGTTEIELPGGNDQEMLKLRNEYFALAKSLKELKESLGMKSGIENEIILDKSQTSLYDDENIGITNGAYASLYRAEIGNETDQAKINESKETSSKRAIGGGITAGVGTVGGAIGNNLINNK